jgi:hypothetical protein
VVGESVTIFVGAEGQRLGLVGGVAYSLPISVTPISVADVAALLSLGIGRPGIEQLAPGRGAAEGFPAIRIAVDPSEGYVLPFVSE